MRSEWRERVLSAWLPPPMVSTAEWAERYRTLRRTESAAAGPWSNAYAPYLVGLMDLFDDPRFEEVCGMKGAQVGWSEAARNWIGRCAHVDPDPMLIVLPNEAAAEKIMRQRIRPLFRSTPILAELTTGRKSDMTVHGVMLANGFLANMGWSGSPATLASDPIRRVLLDEVDKFAQWSGREADPVSLAHVRTSTYQHNRKIVAISTPTTRDGLMFRLWSSCPLKLWYFVPCPHCGGYQRLKFGQFRWPDSIEGESKDQRAERIAVGNLAWYECEHCKGKIVDRDKPRMMGAGRWASDDQAIDKEGRVIGEWPQTRKVGVHIWQAYALWMRWSEIVADFIGSTGDAQRMQHFRNSVLGEVFEDQIESSPMELFIGKQQRAAQLVASGGPERGTVPAWAGCLLMTADTQKDHFYYVVRAWGHGWRSKRVHHGRVETFEELRQFLYAQWPIEGSELVMNASYLLIDSGGGTAGLESGSRTDQVYQFALTDQTRIIATKGASKPLYTPIKASKREYAPPGGHTPYTVHIRLLDVGYWKDVLSRRVKIPHDESGAWMLDELDDRDYARQMVSEHKVGIRGKTGGFVQRWVQVTSGTANHYWDCEVMQCAAAEIAHVGLIPNEDAVKEQRAAMVQRARSIESQRNGRNTWVGQSGKWL